MNILVIDIGGTNIKFLATSQTESRKFPSGNTLTPSKMVSGVIEQTKDWNYKAVSIGYPGVIKKNKILTEPHNLGSGWKGFDFEDAFKCPVKIINDAAMQALGSYEGGILLFLGLGTGLGSAVVVEGKVLPMEVAHLPYKKGTFEDYVGLRGLQKRGKKKWQKHVTLAIERLSAAINPDDIVLGGGNAKKLTELPAGCRLGQNSFAFNGGFRMWENFKK
jgi:predicted NBD/HSP70 family sugar kinase